MIIIVCTCTLYIYCVGLLMFIEVFQPTIFLIKYFLFILLIIITNVFFFLRQIFIIILYIFLLFNENLFLYFSICVIIYFHLLSYQIDHKFSILIASSFNPKMTYFISNHPWTRIFECAEQTIRYLPILMIIFNENLQYFIKTIIIYKVLGVF